MRPLILHFDEYSALPARVADVLEQHGYELHHTEDPEEAMRLVEERCPVLVVMEIALSGCEGLDLLRGIRDAQGGSIPVLVVTNQPRDTAEHAESIALGCLDFLTKPVRDAELLAAMREVVPALQNVAQTKVPAAGDLSGDLADTPVPELLARLRRRGASGVLNVDRAGTRVGVQLRNGSPVGVSSSGREPVAEALLYETFRWVEGRFAFSQGRGLDSDSMLELAGDPARLLLAGVLDASPARLIRDRLAKRESLYVCITEEPEWALEAEGVGFTDRQRKLLSSLGGEGTLSVLLESGDFEERLVYALWVGGWLDLRTAPTLTLTELLGDMSELEPELEMPEPLPGERERELEEIRRARAEGERELAEFARARAEREQELEELARTREERMRELDELAQARQEREQEHEALAPELEERARELKKLERARERRARELKALARMREKHEQELEELVRAREESARQHEALAPAVEEREQELAELARARAERARELEALARVREEHEQELEELARARQERAQELEESARELKAFARIREEHEQELEELARARAAREQELEDLARARTEHAQELEELARARAQQTQELEQLTRARAECEREIEALKRARAAQLRELEERTPPSDPPGSDRKQPPPVRSEPESEPNHGEMSLVGEQTPAPAASKGGSVADVLRELAQRMVARDDFQVMDIAPTASDQEVHSAFLAILRELPEIESTPANLVLSQKAERIRSRIEAAYGNLRTKEKRRAYSLLREEEEQDRKAKPSAERALEGERWFRKGKTHLEQKRCTEAVEAFGMAAHLDPEQGEYASHLGYALYVSNPTDEVVQREAMEHLACGIKRSPRDELAHVFLGRILKAKGDIDVAKKIFLKALRIKPDFHPAVQELRVLEMRERKSKSVLSRLIGR